VDGILASRDGRRSGNAAVTSDHRLYCTAIATAPGGQMRRYVGHPHTRRHG